MIIYTQMAQKTLKLEDISKLYLENVSDRSVRDGSLEMEVRFNTKHHDKITHNSFKNVTKKLLSCGFECSIPENLLRISSEYLDPKSGKPKMSNMRTQLNGVEKISKYCQNDMFDEKDVIFERKQSFRINDENVPYVDVSDFGFRVSLQVEKRLPPSDRIVQNTIREWKNNKKIFRYLSRSTFVHKDMPVKVEMSMVKSSKTEGRYMIPEYTIKESGVFSEPEHYEIEIEIDNTKIGVGTEYNTSEELSGVLRKVIKYVLSGLQSANYPISYSERYNITQNTCNFYGKM